MATSPKQPGGISDREAAFVREYLVDLNASHAAARAGYAPRTAYRLMQREPVRQAIQAAMDQRAERVNINADYVLTGLHEVAERCMQRVDPILDMSGEQVYEPDRDGNIRPLYKFDAQGACRSLELLGKHLKLFTDRVEMKVTSSLADELTKAWDRLAASRATEPAPADGASGASGGDDDT